MAYGRLDVFWPDGAIRSYPVLEPNVSVGRSTGSSIMLDNTSISRYHFSLSHDAGQMYITDLDSANGTYVDAVKIPGSTPHPLYGGEEIVIGNLRIIYHFLDDTPTRPLTVANENTELIERALGDFSIDLQAPNQGVAPGAHISAELSIVNRSDQPRRYAIDVNGLPRDWVRIDRPTPLVDAADTTFVLITFKPLRQPQSTPGSYPVQIRVYPKEQPERVIESDLTLNVLPYGGFGLALQPTRLSAGDPFILHLHNQGSADLPLVITGANREQALRFTLSRPAVTLTPGQRLAIQGEVHPARRRWFGPPQRYPFDIIVQARTPAGFTIAQRGYMLEKPPLPAWTPLALGAAGVVALLLALFGLLLAAATPPPEPVIAEFEVNSTLIARGEPLGLRWAATDVDDIQLRINGTPFPVGASPLGGSLTLDTTALPADVALLLEGFNGDRQTSRSAAVRIFQPVRVETFVVSPDPVTRFVVENLALEWAAPGAVTTRITGLESANYTQPVEATGPRGSALIPVMLTGPLTLTLQAWDETGQRVEQVYTLNVVNPSCTTGPDGVNLHVGPANTHQVIGTIQGGQAVTVTAQDPSGTWLRVPVGDGVTGWGRLDRFDCAGLAVGNLYREINIPTPPPVQTPTPSPSPTLPLSPPPSLTPTASGG